MGKYTFHKNGTHNFHIPVRPLQTRKILVVKSTLLEDWAFPMPSLSIGEAAIVRAPRVFTTSANTSLVWQ
jgi:hypothetical protein